MCAGMATHQTQESHIIKRVKHIKNKAGQRRRVPLWLKGVIWINSGGISCKKKVTDTWSRWWGELSFQLENYRGIVFTTTKPKNNYRQKIFFTNRINCPWWERWSTTGWRKSNKILSLHKIKREQETVWWELTIAVLCTQGLYCTMAVLRSRHLYNAIIK